MTLIDKIWYRPALIIFTETEPVASTISASYNIGSPYTNYIVLTDDNRSDLGISIERLEFKKRMVNGRMRSYHVADKKSFDVSWSELPSASAGVSEASSMAGVAAGKEMFTWYKDHPQSFYMIIVYDTPDHTGVSSDNATPQYRLEWHNVFFESFNYSITRRGAIYDHWEVSMSLVEV